VNRDELMSELAALVGELCDTHLHHEVVWDDNGHRRKRMRRVYTTTQDGLLAQLREIGHEGLNVGGSSAGAGGKPGSKPPGLFEAMSRHVYIAVTVASWCRVQGVALRMSVEDNIRGLVGAASSMDDNTLGAVRPRGALLAGPGGHCDRLGCSAVPSLDLVPDVRPAVDSEHQHDRGRPGRTVGVLRQHRPGPHLG
jgi:hypothetical protein